MRNLKKFLHPRKKTDRADSGTARALSGHWPCLLVLCAAAFMILANLGNQYLWDDEAQTALIAGTILTHGIPLGHDGRHSFSQDQGKDFGAGRVWKWHPWLQFYLVAPFFALFGAGTLTARLPFALLGLAAVPLIYALALALWGSRRAAVLASVMLAANVPFLILVRQCRYYSPTIFFVLLGLYAYTRITSGKRHGWTLFAVSALLLFHSQYIHCAALLAAVVIHAALFHRPRLRGLLLLSAGITALSLPWIVWFADMGGIVGGYGSPLARMVSTGGVCLRQLMKHVSPPLVLALPAAAIIGHAVWRRRLPGPIARRSDGLALILIFAVLDLAITCGTATYPFFRIVGPLVPIVCLLMAVIADAGSAVFVGIGPVVVAALLVTGPIRQYVYEITHNFDGPTEGIVQHLNRHGRDSDTVAITYGDLPLKFYTKMRIVGGLTGEDLTPARDADWVIIRRYYMAREDKRVMNYLLDEVRFDRYERITLPHIDTLFENREEPDLHRFRTAREGGEPVVIYHRRAR